MYLDGTNLGLEFVHVHLGHVPIGTDVNDGAVVDLGADLGHKLVFLLLMKQEIKYSSPTLDDSSQYRASHVLEDLGWVDLDLECSTILLEQ